jgi:hypothetical protein
VDCSAACSPAHGRFVTAIVSSTVIAVLAVGLVVF